MQTEHAATTFQQASGSRQYTQLPPEEVRICVVEDNRVCQRIFEKFLDRLCYTNFHIYTNGKDAVEAIQQQAAEGEPYHLVFMDDAMPVMGGLEATKLIRADLDEAVRNVPIVGMHAHMADSDGWEKFVSLGANDVIRKPIYAKILLEKIEMIGNPPRLVEIQPVEEVEAKSASADSLNRARL